jgi:hypothetical protein
VGAVVLVGDGALVAVAAGGEVGLETSSDVHPIVTARVTAATMLPVRRVRRLMSSLYVMRPSLYASAFSSAMYRPI